MFQHVAVNEVRGVLARVLGFSLGLLLLFTLATWLVPQRRDEAPAESPIDTAALDAVQLVALGERLFDGKGMCALCHQPPPAGRAPDIRSMDMAVLAAERLADARYAGKAIDAESYLRESLLEPGRYVAPGWGMVGADGADASPMPAVDKPPISLSPPEIDAVIAYLLSEGSGRKGR